MKYRRRIYYLAAQSGRSLLRVLMPAKWAGHRLFKALRKVTHERAWARCNPMSGALDHILPSLASLGLWAYWIIGFATMLEAFFASGVFVPGTLIVDLRNAGVVASASSLRLSQPRLGQSVAGDPWFSDGKAEILTLR